YLLLVPAFESMLVPHQVLQRSAMLMGDIEDVIRPGEVQPQPKEPWLRLPQALHDAVWREPASQRLIFYTSGNESGWTSMDWLLRDRMPPMEDLIVGGQPAPIGMASAVAVIIGGLFLLYRHLIDWRIPLLSVLV